MTNRAAKGVLFLCRLLQLSVEANLDLAHLTWCSTLDSDSEHMTYMQRIPTLVSRYVTYVETAAPLFSWPFLHRIVLPTLVEVQTGMLSCHMLYSH